MTFPISLNYTLLAHCKTYITLLYSTGPRTVPFFTLLAHWQSRYHYTTVYWPTDIPFITQLYSTGPRTVPFINQWHTGSHYITLYWPTDSPLYHSTDTLAVTISLYYSLLARWQSLYRYTGPLAVPISLYYTLLAHWQSLYHSTTLYGPTSTPNITLLFSSISLTVPLSLYYSLLAPLQCLYHAIFSTGTMTVPISLYHTQLPLYSTYITLPHNQSLYHSILLKLPTDSPYSTNILYFPLTVPISLYNTFLAH